ncbi:glyoxylase-like metal-dependent hydrolase (beta-lactamase superfamily II)/rhodanese-related sulfurtransferase [Inhella inkyongensis]|uniref:Glyoxylase-like metal-dependent hydrolase (Beta-lactamase superfamily II)/rhodanese-related sulfurtransferase n=1 Tax=Inhella inkyongensis TaxID=392593 RepID=A0A840S6G0_9BURK|nr:glyoxylase-like metal-dependent hydrolase (beta-lactamase superfamily II)/rhodanese-related sulfurtransferase [Inhella inkyongensis]
MLIFRQLFDPASSTYTYLLADGGEALLIDPVFEQVRRDAALLRELGLRLLATVDTHVHADHVSGAWLLKQRLGSRIAGAAAGGAEGLDWALQHGEQLPFGQRYLAVRATPGHTAGCISLVLDDQSLALTGDALLIRGCGRTDFQQGNAAQLYRSVHEQLLSLPPTTLLYPGHDYRGLTVTSVAEERAYNPRFGGASSAADFCGYMNALGLPHPKRMDQAVPANLRCGRPEGDLLPPAEPNWAPLTWAFAGLWEIQPQALEEVQPAPQIVDVRQPDEFDGPLGHIAGARLLPLEQLTRRVDELQRERPVVTVCRSGARSAQAALQLTQAGFPQVANLAGGMLRWRAAGAPVVGGES